jgi:hypothetical protein
VCKKPYRKSRLNHFMRSNKNLLMILAGIVLSGMFIPRAVYADDNERVLMIILRNDGTAGHNFFNRVLVNVTSNQVEDIATLNGNVMFGSDEKTIACIVCGYSKLGIPARLLLLDRQKLTVIADDVTSLFRAI